MKRARYPFRVYKDDVVVTVANWLIRTFASKTYNDQLTKIVGEGMKVVYANKPLDEPQ